MTISLTVLMEEEALYDDLYTGNICTLLIETDNLVSIVNPGGAPDALIYNIKRLVKNIEEKIYVIITTFIPRYWSALSIICKSFPVNSIIVPKFRTYISHKLSRYLNKLNMDNIVEISDKLDIEHVTIMNISSQTYSELILIVDDSVMISTPSLWMLAQDCLNNILTRLGNFKFNYYIGGVPLLPDIIREHAIFIRRFFNKFERVYIGNIRTRSSRNILDKFPINIKILRTGLKLAVS